MRLNLAARAGRWSAAHWKTATFGWVAFVALAVVLGGAIGTKTLGDGDSPGESGRMEKILDEGFQRPADERVLVQSATQTARRSWLRSRTSSPVSRPCPAVTNVRSPLEAARSEQIPPTATRCSWLPTFADLPRRRRRRSTRSSRPRRGEGRTPRALHRDLRRDESRTSRSTSSSPRISAAPDCSRCP